MYLPKQSIPVLRNLNSVSVSNYRGVNASVGRTEFNRLFNRRGTCECKDASTTMGHSYPYIIPRTNNCNRGFAPQCDKNEGCTCVDSRQVQRDGLFYIPGLTPWYAKR